MLQGKPALLELLPTPPKTAGKSVNKKASGFFHLTCIKILRSLRLNINILLGGTEGQCFVFTVFQKDL